MKHKPLRALLAAALLVGGGALAALAAYSPSGRELVSLGYLQKTFGPQAQEQVEDVLSEREQAAYDSALKKLDSLKQTYDLRVQALEGGLEQSAALTDRRLKRGDVLTLGSGASALLLAGEVQVTSAMGELVDVTAGAPLAVGAGLPVRHRCIAAEEAVITLTVASDTAVVSLEGGYSLEESREPDYNMLADALKAMGLFKGSGTAYGSGYDLEVAPTRIQGVIMFLRLIGEEEAALAYTGSCPFTDLPDWCRAYVAYAYEKGYTNGVSATSFAPSQPLRATEYLTLILRVLGYRDSGETPDFSWDAALPKALEVGVLTAKEHKLLTEEPFLRSQIVCVSYYALDGRMKTTGRTLYATLVQNGALDANVADAARDAVTSARLR